MSRLTRYSEKIAKQILTRYASGEIIADILKPPSMPNRVTVYHWRNRYPEFGKAYDIAMSEHASALIDKAYQVVMTADSKGAKLADVQQRFLTWCASKLNRKQYGDKIDLEVKQTIDITPALANAMQRLQDIEPPTLIEAQSSDAP